MKGKERSPAKAKRSRGGEDSSSARTERSSKKPSNGGGKSAGGGSGEGGGSSSRRSLHLEKASRASSREYESAAVGGSGSGSGRHGYGGSNNSKNAESSSSSRGSSGRGVDSRAPPSDSAGSSEYKTLKISELGSALSDEAIEDGLFHEFKRFGDVSVKISRLPPGTGSGDERVAFVNFRRPEDARAAKHARGRLVLYHRPLKIEAVYVGGSSGGGSSRRRGSRSPALLDKESPYGASAVGVAGASPATIRHPATGATQRALSPAGGGAGLGYRDFRLQQLALGRLPPPPLPRELERERDYSGFYDRVRPTYSLDRVAGVAAAAFRGVGTGTATEEEISPEDDQRANRTLFLGNLDISVTESDLRRAFDRFGVITEVDIKRPSRGQTSTYGFLKFENLDMAHRAKLAMSGKVLLRNPIKIGYGKATPTTRLWVGGLGPWVPLAALAREFDRFGTIRTIDYRKGDSWAYIQYESLDAAQAACTHMRGFPLGGPDRRLRVDFADTEHRYQQPYLQPLPLPPPAHYELVAETSAFGAHRGAPPDPLRGARDRTPPLLYGDRDRDLYAETDWVPPPPPVRDRGNRATVYDALESLERRRDGWSLERTRGERELGSSRDPPRKRRLVEDGGRHLDRSPDSERSSSSRKRHCPAVASPQDRSPETGLIRDRYNTDTDRPSSRLLLLDRPSPVREPRKGSLERGQSEKREHKSLMEKERKHRTLASTAIQECKSPAKKDEHTSEGNSSSGSRLKPPQKQQQQDGTSKSGSSTKLCLAWQGMLLLKNSNFPSNMHLLQGDLSVASNLLVEGTTGGKVAQLKITQRLRLDQPKLDEVTRRIKVAGPNGYAILLAVPGTTDNRASSGAGEANTTSTQRPLRNLVSYLKQKQAAGVISLPVGGNKDKENSGVLHAFPPCDFSQQFLDSTAKALAKSEDDYLVMIIVRGAS
ncbi:RNA-binding protein 15 [Pantherophis guttatus]|uniref:RNA-binding protein 15 n=1 Tax=Pantherophis guttatus TaxID=94885 RepID=A0A6P9BRN0_PANGU|nr:RNA-binding protein 15 [Pantherophis guttatus]XP_060545833.1 RNA-binding protein 15 [Pantherophis guttatus]XP_060545834.1 RNA-binding protein 15 [Pantherophis guttatus]XP_060545835.1 RNA-binding protein 15 [Pantherophis guttatus]XP_060545836.1 RNA-binding protein 15 [Pantherophis guttatus]XP_060545837.1 RNA-binding protein 15 [Pantherophis guttatus]XP_060545838.1 RNA-binding protein 15 [Pantherophis guttatus]XP_060545839.1 RNA-binding protein 15 [Pantherophis guttatus]XP_060545840.1 RNA-